MPVTKSQIQAAPDEVIRATLIALCEYKPDFRDRVTGLFRVATSAVKKKREADDAADDQEPPEAKRQKRKTNNAADKQELPKIEGLHVCVMCEVPFLDSENEGKICWHHPEEPTCEKYCDYQYDTYHRDMTDFSETLQTMPEAFSYPCCDEQFEESTGGCRWGKHYATHEERDNDPLREDWPPSEGEDESE